LENYQFNKLLPKSKEIPQNPCKFQYTHINHYYLLII